MGLQPTVDTLLRLLAQKQKADVVALSAGERRQEEFSREVVVPLGGALQQRLFLGWRQPGPAPDLPSAAPLIDALSLVLAMNAQERRIHELQAESARLEWKLADSRMAERMDGLIANSEVDPLIIKQQVGRMLASMEDITVASQRIDQLKTDLADRRQIAVAKAVLQARHGLTEQEANACLRQTSRSSRRPIVEVAKELSAKQPAHRASRSALCTKLVE